MSHLLITDEGGYFRVRCRTGPRMIGCGWDTKRLQLPDPETAYAFGERHLADCPVARLRP